MKYAKKAAQRLDRFVDDHKVGIAIVATSTFWIWLMRLTAKERDEFLRENGLYEEYYHQNTDQ